MFGVVPSPTPMTPISLLRTTRTATPGSFFRSVIAASKPALPAPRMRTFWIMAGRGDSAGRGGIQCGSGRQRKGNGGPRSRSSTPGILARFQGNGARSWVLRKISRSRSLGPSWMSSRPPSGARSMRCTASVKRRE